MDDSGWPALFLIASLLATVLLARLSSIGNALSRTTLERLRDANVPHARWLLAMYRPRYVLGQVVMSGQITSIAVGCIAFAHLTDPFRVAYLSQLPILLYHILTAGVFVFCALFISSITPAYHREEGSDSPLPKISIYYPLYLLFLLPSLLLQRAQTLLLSEDDNKARKEEELRQIVETETEEGTIEIEEREMIEGIFDFGETTVKEVMVPRIDMVCAEINTPSEELLSLIRKARHSRIPIYEGRVDHIKGVVYVKDLLHVISAHQAWDISTVMRPSYFVPENKKIAELMAEFRMERVHMAVVVDEYGGTSGLVTLEDLIEEIVGEIHDEYDDEEQLFHWDEEGQVLTVDARITIEDLNLLLNMELPQDGYETLGGFIYNHLGHVPNPRESFEFVNLAMSILEVEGQRIATVRIEKREKTEHSEDEAEEIA